MWRIRLNTTINMLALEVRDSDLLLTQFYTLGTDGFILQQLALPEAQAWWQGLEEAEHGQIYLHGYGDKKLGQHKGIVAVAPETGYKVWEQTELAYYGIAPEGIVAYHPKQPEAPMQVLAPKSGVPTGQVLNQVQAAEVVAQHSRSRYADCHYPVLYREGRSTLSRCNIFWNYK
ncbi:DUF4905 domain-containing protein [Pontibacter rugosus]